MMFMGGPIGTVVTLLGLAATAWMVWGDKAKSANDKVVASTVETTTEMIARLDKQIEKLKERNRLQGGSAVNPKIQGLGEISEADKAALQRAKEEIDDAVNGTGRFAGRSPEKRKLAVTSLTEEYEKALGRVKQAQEELGKSKDIAFNAKYADWLGQNGTAAQKEAYELEKLRKEYGRVTPEMEKFVKAKYADKGAGQAAKQEATAYQNLITSIREKIAANKLELSGYDKLSESQKISIKLDEAIATGKNKLNPKHVEEARALIKQAEAQEKAIKAQEKAKKLQEDQDKAIDDTVRRNADVMLQLQERARGLELEIELYGRGAEAAVMADAAKVRATASSMAISEEYRAELIAQAEQLEKIAGLQGKKDALDVSTKAAKQAGEDWKRAAESIEQSLTDALLRGFESGKGFGRNLVDTLKNMFSTLVLRPVIQAAVSPVSNSIMGAMQGYGGAAGGSTLGNAMSLFSAGKSIYSGFSAGLSSSMGGLVTQFGNMFGSQAVSAFGTGMSLTTSQAATAASAYTASGNTAVAGGLTSGASAGAYAIPIAGWIAAGMALSSNLYKSGWQADNGSMNTMGNVISSGSKILDSALRGIGLSKSTANIFSGMSTYVKLFGRKNPEVESQGIQGTFGGAGFSGDAYANILEKGGVFRSDKRYVKTAALSQEQDAGFDATYKALVDAAKGFASTLGIEASIIDGYNKQIKLQLGEDEAKNQEAIAKLFGEIGDELSLRLLPSLSDFKVAGETVSATLQRLVTGYATVDEALTAIGMQFGAVGVASIEARERLLAASGGLEAFAVNTAGFQQNFLTEAERNAPVLKMVTEQMTALGLAGVDARDEFKAVVLGLDLTTEAGAAQYGALMKLQAAFAQVYPAIDQAAIAAAELAKAEERANAIREQRLNLQDQLDELTMAEVQLLEKRRAAIDESNRPLFDQIEAFKASKVALEAQAEAQRNATQAAEEARAAAVLAAKDRGSNLLSGVDSAFSALQSVVGREKSLLQETANAHRNLSSALRGTLDSMSAAGREMEDRQDAQAQIQAMLAIAKASGVLPSADSLKGALSVLSKDASSMFATQQDYLRDFYSTQNDIAALAGLTDEQLSVEEKSLKALDDILVNAQKQVEALKGIDLSVFSLTEAIRAFEVSLGAAKGDPVASAGGAIADLYKNLLGRPADAAGLDFWKDKAASGVSFDAIREAIISSAEYKKLKGIPGFANGGDHAGGLRWVGEFQPELEATGPSRIHTASSLMDALRSPAGNSEALTAAVDRLTETVARQERTIANLQSAASETSRQTRRTADTLERVTRNGDKMVITEE